MLVGLSEAPGRCPSGCPLTDKIPFGGFHSRGTKWLSETATERVSGTSDWRKLTVSAVASAKADTLVVSLNLSRSKGTAWFDDVKLSGKSNLLGKAEYVLHNTESWFFFEFPLNDANLDSIDLTGLLHTPAGRHGFVTVRPDGHFYTSPD